MTDESSDHHIYLRVGIVGIQRARVAKVISILSSLPRLLDDPDEPVPRNIHIEYIPCVATFDSYEDEHGNQVRYLTKLEHYGSNIDSKHGESLATFFDEQSSTGIEKLGNTIRLSGIAAFAIGRGVEMEEDIEAVSNFIRMLSGQNDNDQKKEEEKILIESIQPNPDYSSMTEENLAYKALSTEEKEEATTSQTIGPGKMAKFVRDVALRRIPKTKKEAVVTHEKLKEAIEPFDPMSKLIDYDPTMTRYACKICRTILFAESDLQNPSHSKSQHKFSSRKTKSGANVSNSRCESLFLADGVGWMGDIASSSEGKLTCPKCNAKLGLFRWHGNQCSCGTWVAPAIQIHLSKVDALQPNGEQNIKEIVSPLAALHVAGSHLH
jgi:dual specificity phosphatase 12